MNEIITNRLLEFIVNLIIVEVSDDLFGKITHFNWFVEYLKSDFNEFVWTRADKFRVFCRPHALQQSSKQQQQQQVIGDHNDGDFTTK